MATKNQKTQKAQVAKPKRQTVTAKSLLLEMRTMFALFNEKLAGQVTAQVQPVVQAQPVAPQVVLTPQQQLQALLQGEDPVVQQVAPQTPAKELTAAEQIKLVMRGDLEAKAAKVVTRQRHTRGTKVNKRAKAKAEAQRRTIATCEQTTEFGGGGWQLRFPWMENEIYSWLTSVLAVLGIKKSNQEQCYYVNPSNPHFTRNVGIMRILRDTYNQQGLNGLIKAAQGLPQAKN